MRSRALSYIRGVLICGAWLVILCHAPGAAADENEDGNVEVPEELFLQEMALAQEQFALQTTMGGIWNHDRHQSAHSVTMPLSVEFGLSDHWQVGLELPVEIVATTADTSVALGQIEIGTLYTLVEHAGTGLVLSAGIDVAMPAIGADDGSGAVALEPFMAAYKPMGDFALHAAMALEWEPPLGSNAETEVEAHVALGALFAFGPWLPTLELQLQATDESLSVALAPGLLWHPARDWEIGVAAVLTHVRGTLHPGAMISLTREWELFASDTEAGEDD